jgi:hypothetical protein
MNCSEVLSALSTESLRDMPADSPVMLHCVECPECARVTTLVREREYEAASVLNGLPPMSDPVGLAEQAVVTSRRRRVGRIGVVITGAALVATIWIASWIIFIPAMNRADEVNDSALRTETMQLSCLSPRQAADIISPYVRSHGSSYYIPTTGIAAITVRGNAREVSTARQLIGEFEEDPSAACRISTTTDAPKIDDGVEGGVSGGIGDAVAATPAAKAATAAAAKALGKVPTAHRTK